MTALLISAFWPARYDEADTMPVALAALIRDLSQLDDRMSGWGVVLGPNRFQRMDEPIMPPGIREEGLQALPGSGESITLSLSNGRHDTKDVSFLAVGGSKRPSFSLASRFIMWLHEPQNDEPEAAYSRLRAIVAAIASTFHPDWIDVTDPDLRAAFSGDPELRPRVGPILYLDSTRRVETHPTTAWVAEQLESGQLLYLKGWRAGEPVPREPLTTLRSALDLAGARSQLVDGPAYPST